MSHDAVTHEASRFSIKRYRDGRLRYEVDKKTGCWNWVGSLDSNGRAQIGMKLPNGKFRTMRAARVFYEHFIGPIPEGHYVLHACDNPKCVSIAHLRTGTQKENMKEASQRGRLAQGADRPNSKLHQDQVRAIRFLLERGRGVREIARAFAVGPTTVRDIRDHKVWKHV